LPLTFPFGPELPLGPGVGSLFCTGRTTGTLGFLTSPPPKARLFRVYKNKTNTIYCNVTPNKMYFNIPPLLSAHLFILIAIIGRRFIFGIVGITTTIIRSWLLVLRFFIATSAALVLLPRRLDGI
jgi:hypothetical protein